MLNTCNSTDNPPKPNKNAQIIILIEIFFIEMSVTKLIPFVNSIIPVIIPDINEVGILRKLNIGVKTMQKKSNILEEDKIEIRTLKSITKPPIITIVLILFDIHVDKISPKFLKFTVLFFLIFILFLSIDFIFNFQNLKIIPTVIHERMCVNNNKNPISVLPNNEIPTVPIIKRGPELLVKASNLSASSLLHIPLLKKFEIIFAPTGYPLIIPIINANEPSPGTLNIGLINLLSFFPKISITLVYESNSVAIKKGSKEGITEFANKLNPFFAADRFCLEKITKQTVNKTNKMDNKLSLNDINKNLYFRFFIVLYIVKITYLW